jgi:hypothetical protein
VAANSLQDSMLQRKMRTQPIAVNNNNAFKDQGSHDLSAWLTMFYPL